MDIKNISFSKETMAGIDRRNPGPEHTKTVPSASEAPGQDILELRRAELNKLTTPNGKKLKHLPPQV